MAHSGFKDHYVDKETSYCKTQWLFELEEIKKFLDYPSVLKDEQLFSKLRQLEWIFQSGNHSKTQQVTQLSNLTIMFSRGNALTHAKHEHELNSSSLELGIRPKALINIGLLILDICNLKQWNIIYLFI